MTDRQKKTPEERAEEALGVARRAVARADKKAREARQAVAETEADLKGAVARMKYLAANPDLPEEAREEAEGFLANFTPRERAVAHIAAPNAEE